jgi:hypothetical protein
VQLFEELSVHCSVSLPAVADTAEV